MGAFVKKWFHLVLIFVFAYLAGSLAGQAAKLSQLVLSKWCGMFICFCFTEAVKNGKCSIRKMTGRCIGVV